MLTIIIKNRPENDNNDHKKKIGQKMMTLFHDTNLHVALRGTPWHSPHGRGALPGFRAFRHRLRGFSGSLGSIICAGYSKVLVTTQFRFAKLLGKKRVDSKIVKVVEGRDDVMKTVNF